MMTDVRPGNSTPVGRHLQNPQLKQGTSKMPARRRRSLLGRMPPSTRTRLMMEHSALMHGTTDSVRKRLLRHHEPTQLAPHRRRPDRTLGKPRHRSQPAATPLRMLFSSTVMTKRRISHGLDAMAELRQQNLRRGLIALKQWTLTRRRPRCQMFPRQMAFATYPWNPLGLSGVRETSITGRRTLKRSRSLSTCPSGALKIQMSSRRVLLSSRT